MGLFDRKSQHCGERQGNVAMFQGAMMLTYSLSAARWEEDGYGGE